MKAAYSSSPLRLAKSLSRSWVEWACRISSDRLTICRHQSCKMTFQNSVSWNLWILLFQLRRAAVGVADGRSAVPGHRRTGGGVRSGHEQAGLAHPLHVSWTLCAPHGRWDAVTRGQFDLGNFSRRVCHEKTHKKKISRQMFWSRHFGSGWPLELKKENSAP